MTVNVVVVGFLFRCPLRIGQNAEVGFHIAEVFDDTDLRGHEQGVVAAEHYRNLRINPAADTVAVVALVQIIHPCVDIHGLFREEVQIRQIVFIFCHNVKVCCKHPVDQTAGTADEVAVDVFFRHLAVAVRIV